MSIYARITRVVTTIIMIAINALATTQLRWGVSTWDLSDQLSTLITPAGWTFSIWSVIYIWLGAVMVLIAWKQITVSRHIIRAHIISCLCNALWIVVWQYGYLTASMLVILWLLASLIVIDQYIIKHEVEHFAWWVRSVFLIYFWWVQIATLLMTTIYLIYGLGRITTETLWWPMLVIILAWVANLLVIYRAGRIETSLVALWALAGIYRWQNNPSIQATCLTVGWILLIAIAFHLKSRSHSKLLSK